MLCHHLLVLLLFGTNRGIYSVRSIGCVDRGAAQGGRAGQMLLETSPGTEVSTRLFCAAQDVLIVVPDKADERSQLAMSAFVAAMVRDSRKVLPLGREFRNRQHVPCCHVIHAFECDG